MKKRFTWFGIIAAIVLGISTCFVGCDTEMNDIVNYRGQVVYINTTTPFPDLTVKVTDGYKTHNQTQTDAGGLFSIKVRVSEIDGSYYLLAGDSTCIPKKVALGGFGQAEVDLGVIEVEGPALPTVVTTPLQSVKADEAILGGEVQTDGRLSVTARGICYGKDPYPVVEGMHTTEGAGLGAFTSSLKNLEYNTIYYARAYATNKMGTAYGDQVKFTTEEGVAIVTTDTIINITAHSAKCKGHVESDGGFSVVKRGTCWSKRPDPTIDDNCTDDGSGKGEFTSSMNNLIENTTYYVRTYATNSTATVYGEQKIITTKDGLAVVTTDSIPSGSITATGFTAYGTVLEDCDIQVTARGFCYGTAPEPTIDDNKYTTSGRGLGDFKSNVTQLEYATTYYVRAYATNETGTVYGKQLEITTLSGLPKVTTDSVSNIGSVKATCGGNVTYDGTLTVTARGVCYGTEPQPTLEDSHTSDGKGTGKFTSSLKNLQDKTTYYVRAYATTDAGTSYGEQRKFKTENGIPVVVLNEVGEPTANSVACKGNVTGDGGVTVTERGFCYGLSQYPTNTDAHIALGNGIGEFSGSLTGLTVNTTYYVRAYAVNSLGVGYSEQKSFTTKDGLATITTAEATSTATSISTGGNVTSNGGYAVTERGVCYSATNAQPTTVDEKVLGGSGNGAFNVSITGLSAGTTYNIRAYAINENGTAYGESVAILTKSGNASVTVSDPTNITAFTASASVTVTDAGSATLQSCGICWSTNPTPTISDSKMVAPGKVLNTAYPCNMSELQPGTTYYVRGYATTDVATTYSEPKTFTTQNGSAIVELGAISDITALTASSTVTVTDASGATLQSCGICWSTNPNPTTTDNTTVAGGKSLNTAYTCNMSELQPGTIYYVRGYATTDVATSYSEQKTFTTLNGSAIVELGAISDITALTASSTVTVTDASGATLQSCGICWSINPNPTTTDNKSVAGGKSLNTAYTCNISELQPGTTYYVRGYATTDVATTYSEPKIFTTQNGSAIVELGTITDITALTASSTVTVTDASGATLQSCGICWSTNPNPIITDSKEVALGKVLNTAYTCNMSDLQPGTTYYVRAYATTDITTSYSTQRTFKTNIGLPVVQIGSTTANATSIVANCEVTDNGGYTVTERGICYSQTNAEPTLVDSKMACGSGNGSFSLTISPLNVSTKYYVRAYATNMIGTSYSSVTPITTLNGKATVKMDDVTNLTPTSATSAVTLTSVGGATIQSCGICWSTNPNPTITDNKVVAAGKSLNTAYTCNLSPLLPGTTYNVCAYATTDITTSYSAVKTFTTLINVSGVVKSEAGTAISNATVTFKQNNSIIKTATSNINGQFSTQLLSGSYIVEATAQGYDKYSQTMTVDNNPVEITMRPLGILTGTVYDDDNIPLANATVKVKAYGGTTLSTVSNSNGVYQIDNIPLGQTSNITCTITGYSLVSDISNRTINSGNNILDIQMAIDKASSCSVSWLSFVCNSDGMCGTTVTKTFQIQNHRQKEVSWFMSGIPSKGIKFNPTTGNIPAKSSIVVTATFTYPGPSVAGSTRTTLSNCQINNKTAYTYIWNWANCSTYSLNPCCMGCLQEISVIVGNSTNSITLQFNQEVAWY